MLLKHKKIKAHKESKWRQKWEWRMCVFTILFVIGLTIWSYIAAPNPSL